MSDVVGFAWFRKILVACSNFLSKSNDYILDDDWVRITGGGKRFGRSISIAEPSRGDTRMDSGQFSMSVPRPNRGRLFSQIPSCFAAILELLLIGPLLLGCANFHVPSDQHHDPCAEEFHELDCGGDPDCGCLNGNQKRPEDIPWPRFHPIPTRPVFGVADQ
jgi:hypothetical protein